MWVLGKNRFSVCGMLVYYAQCAARYVFLAYSSLEQCCMHFSGMLQHNDTLDYKTYFERSLLMSICVTRVFTYSGLRERGTERESTKERKKTQKRGEWSESQRRHTHQMSYTWQVMHEGKRAEVKHGTHITSHTHGKSCTTKFQCTSYIHNRGQTQKSLRAREMHLVC